jgi:peptide/nickel transport system permease protein
VVLRMRAGQALLALVLLSMLIFVAGRATGSPADALLPLTATLDQRARLAHDLGLDQPLPVQYWLYVSQFLHGNLGQSVALQEPVWNLIVARLPASALLAVLSTALALGLALPLGAIAALHRGSLLDGAICGASMLFQSMPVFWLAIILVEVFAVRVRLVPSGGFSDPRGLILPTAVLTLFGLGNLVRLFRTSMLDVLGRPHVTFARSKGLSNWRVVIRHVARNALLGVITAAGVYLAGLFSMAFAVEAVFNWPGLGQLGFSAIQRRDFPVLQGIVLVTGIFVIVVNFAIDLLYTYLDPRVRA